MLLSESANNERKRKEILESLRKQVERSERREDLDLALLVLVNRAEEVLGDAGKFKVLLDKIYDLL